MVVELTELDRARILAALFELAITHCGNDAELTRIRTLVLKLGGDPEVVVFAHS